LLSVDIFPAPIGFDVFADIMNELELPPSRCDDAESGGWLPPKGVAVVGFIVWNKDPEVSAAVSLAADPKGVGAFADIGGNAEPEPT
jgi:hypothetical protein